jgi:hypothetical protein
LKQFLELKSRPDGFEDDYSFYKAIHGLCSALHTVHDFGSPGTLLKMKGYHHDLKPGNILFSQGRFILSDFGLSSLISASDQTQPKYKPTLGYYLAPECPGKWNEFNAENVGQEADVWALGCILLVVLIYMQSGPEGINKFWEGQKRKIKGHYIWVLHDSDGLYPEVPKRMEVLQHCNSSEAKGLVKLIKEMLQLQPSKRPSMRTVSSVTEYLAVKSMHNATLGLFEKVRAKNNRFFLEFERFRQFGHVVCPNEIIIGAEWPLIPGMPSTGNESTLVQETLKDLHDYLHSLDESIVNSLGGPAHHKVQRYVDTLWGILPSEALRKLKRSVERELLDSVDIDPGDLSSPDITDLSGVEYEIAIRITIKRMVASFGDSRNSLEFFFGDGVEERDVRQIRQNKSQQYPYRSFRPSEVKLPGSNSWKDVVIEMVEYHDRLNKDEIEQLKARADAVAKLLNYEGRPDTYACLRCVGFYHEVPKHSFGFVFEIPSVISNPQFEPQHSNPYPTPLSTLFRKNGSKNEIFEKSMGIKTHTPSLTLKFKLAQRLARAMLEWHKVGWLHRRFSSSKIIFFERVSEPQVLQLSEPFIMGFSHGREDEKDHFTMGPTEDDEQRLYCDPRYNETTRHQVEYDYYSLGLVLLEIGHWRALSTMTKPEHTSDLKALKDRIMTKYVKGVGELEERMGSVYQKVVKDCLEMCSLEKAGIKNFEENILIELEKCHA